ncbi:YdcF family protein [Phenylobacterium sp.]|uniref:YdcF family protein n=1 Tax=Phenylobacterium sp. TaxID=1871053 RepID=UPI003562DF49
MRRRGLGLGVLAALLVCAGSAAWAQSPAYRFVRSDDPAADANAYLLTLIAADPEALRAAAGDAALAAIGRRLVESRSAVQASCRATSVCPVERMMLSQAEIAAAGDALAGLAKPGSPLARLARERMRPSGRFQKYAALEDTAMLRAAWIETAEGVNRLYRVYALGEKPRYPDIDSASYPPGDAYLRTLLRQALEAETDRARAEPFFAAWTALGFDLLTINQRDEAGRYEPLETGENAPAMARARRLDWGKWPYAAIIVPGQGLEAAETRLSPGGASRDRLAVKRWREGKAPFLVVSGGHVHPNKTPFAEAVEMKHDLMAHYGVPAEAIFIDPYARHTTTNLRNAVRLLFRAGAPPARTLLVTTSGDQSGYIEGPGFADRCAKELGYQPMTGLTRLSAFDLAGAANLVSLHADPQDPLDP